MKIKLRNNWFSPQGFRYKSGVCEIPDELCEVHADGPLAGEFKQLPSTAVRAGAAPVVKPASAMNALRDLDLARAASDAEGRVRAEAEATAVAQAALAQSSKLALGGPTIEQWVEQGYAAGVYPPDGYAEVPSEALEYYKEHGEMPVSRDTAPASVERRRRKK